MSFRGILFIYIQCILNHPSTTSSPQTPINEPWPISQLSIFFLIVINNTLRPISTSHIQVGFGAICWGMASQPEKIPQIALLLPLTSLYLPVAT